MFVLRRKDDRRIFSIGDGQSVSLICRDQAAAEKAVRKVRKQFGVECAAEQANKSEFSGFWFLVYRNGRKYGPESGVSVICCNESVASYCAGNLRESSGKIVRPVPVGI
jgi:hypothetical protein